MRKVINCLYSERKRFIKWPTEEEATNTSAFIENRFTFPKVIGALDGTHINISKPKQNAESYINRKGHHSIQLQVKTNFLYDITF